MTFTWNLDPIIVHFSESYGLRYYGLLFSAALVLGYYLFLWQVRRAGGSEEDAYDLVLPAVLGVVIGARLGHVFFYQWDRFVQDPLWIFQIWQGGLASHGALLGVLTGLWIYARRKKQSYLECLDRLSPSAAAGTILIRIGNWFNSEIVGRLTDQTWGVRFPLFDGAAAPLRHPSQLYEAFMGAVVLFLVLAADRKFGREKRPRGLLFATFLAAYFTGRFLVEFFKERHLLPYSVPLSMGQILSVPAALFGYWLLYRCLKHPRPASWRVDPPEKPGPDTSKTKTAGRTQNKKKRRK